MELLQGMLTEESRAMQQGELPLLSPPEAKTIGKRIENIVGTSGEHCAPWMSDPHTGALLSYGCAQRVKSHAFAIASFYNTSRRNRECI